MKHIEELSGKVHHPFTGVETRVLTSIGVNISAQSLNPAIPGIRGGTVAIFIALYLALVIGALISISKSAHATPTVKAIWFLIVVVAPFLGSILWFTLGKPRAPRRSEHGSDQ